MLVNVQSLTKNDPLGASRTENLNEVLVAFRPFEKVVFHIHIVGFIIGVYPLPVNTFSCYPPVYAFAQDILQNAQKKQNNNLSLS